ncbi:MAG: UrcA family protein [Allosphingosinicella sp.]
MTRIRYIPLALIASAIAAAPVAASPTSTAVRYGDLDLNSPAGIAAFDARIARAVRQVCGSPYPRDLQGRRDVERCRAETLASTQAQRSDALAVAQSRAIQLASRGQ